MVSLVAARRRRARRLSDGQGLGRGHRLQPGRRLHHHRPAQRERGGRHAGRGPAASANAAAGRSGDHRQPLRRARPADRQAAGGGDLGQGAQCRQHGRAGRGQARRMRHRPHPSHGSGDGRVQPSPADRRSSSSCRAIAGCRASSSAKGDARFDGRSVDEAIAAALADPDCIMVNRNAGSGTRILIDRLLAGAKPAGYWSQPKSHNAVAVAVAQGRADWGVAIDSVARQYGLGFIPLQDEHYDFVGAEGAARPAGGAAVPRLARRPIGQGGATGPQIRDLTAARSDTPHPGAGSPVRSAAAYRRGRPRARSGNPARRGSSHDRRGG